MKLRIGVDFDNTIIRYDEAFHRAARERGWIPPGFAASKTAIKDRLIAADGDDLRWQALQAEVYGRLIRHARPFERCPDFLRSALKAGHELFIVSHKSKASHFDPSVSLRGRALDWLRRRRIMRNGHPDPSRIGRANVLFADTRRQKVRMISELGLDVFIDDLRPVLDHPAFPKKTVAIHFDRSDARDWSEVSVRVQVLEQIGPAAFAALFETFGERPVKATPAARGGNNRIFKVELESGRAVTLKRYLLDARDPRDRAGTEFAACSLMWANGIKNVPQPCYLNPDGEFALYSWIEGRPLRAAAVSPGHIRQAARFIARLKDLHRRPSRRRSPEAADSRRSLEDYVRQVERRLGRIRRGVAAAPKASEARRFVEDVVVPLKERVVRSFRSKAGASGLDLRRPLPASERTLSPSDFGFHNALLDRRGRVRFLDFEYFGQDDPAKLVADFRHHVGQDLPPARSDLFERLVSGAFSPAFPRRLELVKGIIAFEWLLIVLNVLTPESLARRRFSNPDVDPDALVALRLKTARRLARRLRP